MGSCCLPQLASGASDVNTGDKDVVPRAKKNLRTIFTGWHAGSR